MQVIESLDDDVISKPCVTHELVALGGKIICRICLVVASTGQSRNELDTEVTPPASPVLAVSSNVTETLPASVPTNRRIDSFLDVMGVAMKTNTARDVMAQHVENHADEKWKNLLEEINDLPPGFMTDKSFVNSSWKHLPEHEEIVKYGSTNLEHKNYLSRVDRLVGPNKRVDTNMVWSQLNPTIQKRKRGMEAVQEFQEAVEIMFYIYGWACSTIVDTLYHRHKNVRCRLQRSRMRNVRKKLMHAKQIVSALRDEVVE